MAFGEAPAARDPALPARRYPRHGGDARGGEALLQRGLNPSRHLGAASHHNRTPHRVADREGDSDMFNSVSRRPIGYSTHASRTAEGTTPGP